jgi:hypothetical protein
MQMYSNSSISVPQIDRNEQLPLFMPVLLAMLCMGCSAKWQQDLNARSVSHRITVSRLFDGKHSKPVQIEDQQLISEIARAVRGTPELTVAENSLPGAQSNEFFVVDGLFDDSKCRVTIGGKLLIIEVAESQFHYVDIGTTSLHDKIKKFIYDNPSSR